MPQHTVSPPLWRLALALVLAWLWLLPVQAQTASAALPPVPELKARVTDSSGTLAAADRQALEQQLKALEDSTGAQVVVLMVPSTQPEDIAAYAWRVASTWKIGRKDVGDGVLIVVAKNDRRMRIEVARRLEGAIPDIMAARVIDNAMKPRFRADDYAGGLHDAIEQLGTLIRGEQLPAPHAQTGGSGASSEGIWEFFVPFIFFGFAIGMPLSRLIFGKGLGSLVMGGIAGFLGFVLSSSLVIAAIAGFVAMIFTLLANSGKSRGGGPYVSSGGYSSSGGGWSSSSSDSFRSGGGGSFGGGGASGDW